MKISASSKYFREDVNKKPEFQKSLKKLLVSQMIISKMKYIKN